MTNIIFFVTSQLVVGYSWQDSHLPTLSSPGKQIELLCIIKTVVTLDFLKGLGFDVFWVSHDVS